MQKEYKTIKEISGPLVFVEKTEPVSYGELVQVSLPDGSTKRGQVLDTSHEIVVVQIFEGTSQHGSILPRGFPGLSRPPSRRYRQVAPRRARPGATLES